MHDSVLDLASVEGGGRLARQGEGGGGARLHPREQGLVTVKVAVHCVHTEAVRAVDVQLRVCFQLVHRTRRGAERPDLNRVGFSAHPIGHVCEVGQRAARLSRAELLARVQGV